jgi:pimeloyl-ACP methyl ester carboxylesterase
VIVFLGAGVFTPFRWIDLLWLAPLGLLAYLVYSAYATSHPGRLFALFGLAPAIMNLPCEHVAFRSRDGLPLGAWFLAGHTRAAVILAHGLNGSSNSMSYHAEFLFKAGFSILSFDLRAHGRSHGDISSYGVLEAGDVLGALDYLRARPEVDPQKIGALGISLGAQAVLRAAAAGEGLRGVVLEGAGPVSLKDHGPVWRTPLGRLFYPVNWLGYRLGDFMTGIREPEAARSVIARLEVPVLLIACGRGTERRFGQLLYRDAREPKELWELPDARHAGGFFAHPLTYREKVIGFFRNALG